MRRSRVYCQIEPIQIPARTRTRKNDSARIGSFSVANAAAQKRGRARDLWATAEELLAELGESPRRAMDE